MFPLLELVQEASQQPRTFRTAGARVCKHPDLCFLVTFPTACTTKQLTLLCMSSPSLATRSAFRPLADRPRREASSRSSATFMLLQADAYSSGHAKLVL